jgi:Flp pilus assembly protein TadB
MNRKTVAGDRRRRKFITVLWALGLSLLVIVLIYLERTAILYILCTLGVSALLMVVAFSDLRQSDAQNQPLAQANDAAGVATRRK